MPSKSQDKSFTILGIETSCDETAAAVMRGHAPGPGEILSNIVASQAGAHAPYGGVVPEIASRAHLEILDGVIERALDEAKITARDIDGVAATAGPGLIGGVMVGLTTAKGVALGLGKPLIAVNHLMGHALTARLTEGTAFPFLLLLVSGGHCQLLGVGGLNDFRLYGSTIDDAVGEAFDKVAKLLGLAYPGGPEVEKLAAKGNPRAFDLPRPLVSGHNVRRNADFSFSGLKTAVRLLVERQPVKVEDVCASFQAAVIAILTDRTQTAMRMFEKDFPQSAARHLVVAGGVAANRAIAAALSGLCARENYRLAVPPPALCTDNAAMIAWAGLEKLAADGGDGLGTSPRARWPLASLV
ncbi:MAG: tRNA (adenosine(37)-N6)-threonylcarbamoyltransferase complex transferase subunit TsaD [Alphaproteobacteria bacterium]|nr:tRNA (adenosine(37)-N6)-threonylcarbamoyltransferase complex transferase subunit TsaD [Alphaproteobacteria bacterium]